ncbi:hypothetical protein AMTRI_Chr06g174270 [Amborella trichopoda]
MMGSLSGHLPDEPVEEILVKLPAFFIPSFKKVSKSWYTLLSSLCFVHLHSLTPHSPSQPFALFHPSSHKMSLIFTITLKHDENIMQLGEVPHSSSWMPRSIKCSNGVLCVLTNRGAFCPCNWPSTCLPLIHGLRVEYFGFYFRPQTCKFKVLAVLAILSMRIIGHHVVFDSSIEKWEFFDNIEPIKPLISSSLELKTIGPTCYNYNNFYIPYDMNLIAFDMVKEEVEIIPRQPKLLGWNGMVMLLSQLSAVVWNKGCGL